jgi:hypothetical protein
MSDEAQPDMKTRTATAYRATRAASAAGDAVAADYWWRRCIGLLEVAMGRTGSVEHLTPDPKEAHKIP